MLFVMLDQVSQKTSDYRIGNVKSTPNTSQNYSYMYT